MECVWRYSPHLRGWRYCFLKKVVDLRTRRSGKRRIPWFPEPEGVGLNFVYRKENSFFLARSTGLVTVQYWLQSSYKLLRKLRQTRRLPVALVLFLMLPDLDYVGSRLKKLITAKG
ncbi:hypothetical protein TNCV_4669731 [Trichonephila clavipes]|nr:hypothetical protein TNCV_4669731 [Trichonephila clavipes]